MTIDLSKVQTKDIDLDKLSRNNSYDFVTPTTKNVIKFKLLTHGDEKKIDADVKPMNRLNKGGAITRINNKI